MRKVARLAATVIVLLTLVSAVIALYLRTLLGAPEAEGSPQAFTVEPGSGFSSVARRLEGEGLVQSALAIRVLARLKQVDSELKAGDYDLSPSQNAVEILRQLTQGMVRTHPVVLPEGLRATEIADRFEAAGLANARELVRLANSAEFAHSLGIEADGLEGYLFPSTYYFARGLPGEEVLRSLVDQFRRVWADIEPAARAKGMSMNEVVTLASIVEKETGAPEERPLIAAVFLNRLKKNMRLETDPSVIYGIENFDGNLRRRDLDNAKNPFNTYRHGGLPPGPIASPGEASLRAVVEPAETDFLYFVSRNDGTHKFSVTYREHVNAVNHFQKRRRNR